MKIAAEKKTATALIAVKRRSICPATEDALA
jgi:hypothetical protein